VRAGRVGRGGAGGGHDPGPVGARRREHAVLSRQVGGRKALTGKAPSFMVMASKDPKSGNLDRVQVVKGWLDGRGKQHEKVYDVAWGGERKPDPKTGKLPAVGDTVDAATAQYTNSIGAAELATVWTDPDFDPAERALFLRSRHRDPDAPLEHDRRRAPRDTGSEGTARLDPGARLDVADLAHAGELNAIASITRQGYDDVDNPLDLRL
jgi:hypothetical protein